MKKFLCVLLMGTLLQEQAHSQNIGINATGATPNASAMLDVSATDKGMLVPRMSNTQRILIASPATGLLVFDNVSNSFWFYNGTAWIELSSGTTGWKVTGNAGIDSAINFVGTLDDAPLRFRVNNKRAGDIDPSSQCIFLGVNAGVNSNPQIATDNVGVGFNALQQILQGSGNTGVGSQSLVNAVGNNNTAIGFLAGNAITVASQNVAIGERALLSATSGQNVAIGSQALESVTVGLHNTAVGYSSQAGTTGSSNTSLGYSSLTNNLTGFDNVAVGESALLANTGGGYNTAVGASAAVANTSGSQITAVGYTALFNNQTGANNAAVGNSAMFGNVAGSENTAMGSIALFNSNASFNTAVGSASLYNNTTGLYNTAVGRQSASANQIGSFNTAVGEEALQHSGTDYNTAVGYQALINSTTGYCNVAVGDGTLPANGAGNFNVAVGHDAQQFNQDGNHNIAIGAFSGNNIGARNVSNSIGIGNDDYLNGTSNQVLIGNQETLYIGGIVPWGSPSDARIKKNIKEDVKGLDFILKLRPVTYNLDHEAMNRIMGIQPTAHQASPSTAAPINYSGFLAQEVEVAANQTGYDFGGLKKPQNDHDIYGLSYEQFIGPLVKGMQEQQAMIKLQQQTIADMQAKMSVMAEQLTVLQHANGKN